MGDVEDNSLEATLAFASANAGKAGVWWSPGAPDRKRSVRVVGYTSRPTWGEYYVICEHAREDKFDTGNTPSQDWVFLVPPSPASSGLIFGCFYASRIHPDGLAKTSVDASRFPHACPGCGKPAYIGFNSTECSASCGQR